MHCQAIAVLLSAVGLAAATDGAPRQQPAAGSRPARAAAPAGPVSPAWADEPAELGAEARGTLRVATDGKGHYFAFGPYGEEKLLFAGDARKLHAQRIVGASTNGATEFDYRFWEPRASAAWQATTFDYKDGQVDVRCGEEPTRLKLLATGEARALLAGAKLLKPRWRRQAFALARDGAGTYYFVDRLREPDDSRDFRLFVGKRGKLRRIEVQDALLDGGGQVFITAGGRLEFSRGDDGRTGAQWVQRSKRTPLTALEIESHVRFAYTELGVYAGERLGTACDWAY